MFKLLLSFIVLTAYCTNALAEVGSLGAAIAEIKPLAGSSVHGKVKFVQNGQHVLVEARVEGLTPGKHGFHIHEVGDCSATDGSSAGAHFNLSGAVHGGPDSGKRHEGDLGNLVANESGSAFLKWLDPLLVLNGSNSIIGRSILIHEEADDFFTQPTGSSGISIACGVIERSSK